MNDPEMEAPDPGVLFDRAMAAAEAGRIEEAAELLDRAAAHPEAHPDVFWNLGAFHTMLQQHELALEAWEAYRGAASHDWRVRPRLIQTYHLLGDTSRRDDERGMLLMLHRSGYYPTLTAEPHYCLERFSVGQHAVTAYESFERAGDTRVYYEFFVGRPDGELAALYSLGSYDLTTQMQRDLSLLGPDERAYHLDRYDPSGHATLAFFATYPSYDEVRARVVAHLAGDAPLSRLVLDRDEAGAPAETRRGLGGWVRRILGRAPHPN